MDFTPPTNDRALFIVQMAYARDVGRVAALCRPNNRIDVIETYLGSVLEDLLKQTS